MKRIIYTLLFAVIASSQVQAQQKQSNLVEGGKALAELISVFKKGRPADAPVTNKQTPADSCAVKLISDLCFKNSASKDLFVNLYKRTDTGYAAQPFSMKIVSKKQECLYELRSGIYKYKIEADNAGLRVLISEGELKLQPCENMVREFSE